MGEATDVLDLQSAVPSEIHISAHRGVGGVEGAGRHTWIQIPATSQLRDVEEDI